MTYEGNREQIYGHTSYSQHADDMHVANIFHMIGKKNPSYLDLGAHHPFDISNTALFYERGSRGVNVEANPKLLQQFKIWRPEDINVCVGVGPQVGVFPFYMFDDTCGLNSFSPLDVKKLEATHPVRETQEIEIITLDMLVELYCPFKVFPDFLNCDIEGFDFSVLNSATFTPESAPMVICVEVRRNETRRFQDMMFEKGYSMVCRCSENLIFVQLQHVHALY